jgi:hypothetical protein
MKPMKTNEVFETGQVQLLRDTQVRASISILAITFITGFRSGV